MRAQTIAVAAAAIFSCTAPYRAEAATECKQGNALDCYTQALQALHMAEDGLTQSRKDIAELQSQVRMLSAAIGTPESGITARLRKAEADAAALQARLALVDAQTSSLRPGGPGCILVKDGQVPQGWRDAGRFGIIQLKTDPIIFSGGSEYNPSWNWTHGRVACAQ